MKSPKLIFTATSTLLLLAACSSEEDICIDDNNLSHKVEATQIVLSRSEQAAAVASNDFQYSFFNAANKNSNNDDNVVVSPLSARIALSMLANGVDEDSKAQLVEALGCSDKEALNSLSANLLTNLPEIDASAVKISLAQAIWHSNKYTINPAFGYALTNNYNAAISSADMTDKSNVAAIINDWCALKTDGVITNFVKEDMVSDFIMMLNTMCFKGEWSSKFDVANTQRKTFNGSVRNSVVDMMTQTINIGDELAYWKETEKYSAAKIFFGGATENTGFSMIFVLPNENEDIISLSQTISATDLDGMVKETVKFNLPRFSASMSQFNLEETLKSMGVIRIFEEHTSNVFTVESTMYWNLNQGSSISVDENGAQLAAATIASGMLTSPGPGKELNLNRPFLFFVNEHSTGACLMAGRIMNL